MKFTRLNELIEDGEVVEGHWRLDPSHEIQYRTRAQEIKVRGTLLAAEPGALVAAISQKEKNGHISSRLLKLSGEWRVDAKNRIVFEIERKEGENNVLTLAGIWRLGPEHDIIYSYKRQNLKTKKKEIQELTFKGFWDISEKHRLSYFLGGDTNAELRFRGAFQTKSLLAKEGEIRYQLGIEVRGKTRLQTLVFFGKWKISRDLELSFEMEYGDREKRKIRFGGKYTLNDDASISAKLVNEQDKPLGLEVILTKDIFEGDGEAFLRLKKTIEESRLEAGVKWSW
jgi:hypothetical protein